MLEMVCVLSAVGGVDIGLALYHQSPSITALELNPQLVGTISGLMNAAGNLAAIFGPLTAGVIVARTGNWELPFYLVAVLVVSPESFDG